MSVSNVAIATTSVCGANLRTGSIISGGGGGGGGVANVGSTGMSVLDKDNPFAAKHTPILEVSVSNRGSGGGSTVIPASGRAVTASTTNVGATSTATTAGMMPPAIAHAKQFATSRALSTTTRISTTAHTRDTSSSSVGSFVGSSVGIDTTARISVEKKASTLDDPDYNPFNEKIT